MTSTDLNVELRNLIDARLEAVDGVLARAQVSWAERRSIVGELETQIYELLARRSSFPGDEDVRAVLASLDPPEAYIPENGHAGAGEAPMDGGMLRWQWQELPRQVKESIASVVPGAVCVATIIVANGVVLVLIAASDGVIPWLVTLGGLGWLNYVGVQRFRQWSTDRKGNLFNELRSRLSQWLMPKGEPQAT